MMNKRFLHSRIIYISLIVCLLFTCVIPVKAYDVDETEIIVSASAGENGYYTCDPITGTFEYVPPSEYTPQDICPVPATDVLHREDDAISPYVIIGNDDRRPITNPTTRYQSTCLIRSHFGDDYLLATGWLIDDTYVMTAGHVLYSTKYGKFADSINICVGASGGNYVEYRTGFVKAVGAQYVNSTEDNYLTEGMYDDWGVIQLSTPLTESVFLLGRYPVNSASDMEDSIYYTQGYPADLNKDVEPWFNRVMYTAFGTITGNRERYLPVVTTDIDITQGQSGSPVYSYREGYGYTAEGIVISQHGSQGYNGIILYNDYLASYVNSLVGSN